jgi:hypothetical protein
MGEEREHPDSLIHRRLARLEVRVDGIEDALKREQLRLPGLVRELLVPLLHEELPGMMREAVRAAIVKERLVADAERFRALVRLLRRVGVAVVLALATGLVAAALNGWLA